MYWLLLFHGVIIFWCFMKSWPYLWIIISGNYITLNTFFPNTEEIIKCKSYFSRWFSWLRHGATNWKVAGSIPDGTIGISFCRYPSGRSMTLGSTLTEMSNRNISWSGRCVRLTTLPPSCADCLEIREPQPTERFGSVLGLYRDCVIFASIFEEIIFFWYFWCQILFFPL